MYYHTMYYICMYIRTFFTTTYVYTCVWCHLIVLNGKDLIPQDANGMHVQNYIVHVYVHSNTG